MTSADNAVFLSYASQDSAAAQRLCAALRSAGIEVWFDRDELRGGDAWDQKIRRQIHDCALFIPVISKTTVARHEGYFRLEWDLADQRTHMLARNRAFIVPVRLDATPEAGADVPESFQRAHWTYLPDGATPPEFVARIQDLLSGVADTGAARALPAAAGMRRSRPRVAWLAAGVASAALAAALLVARPWQADHPGTPDFRPPAHSIAVLPFVDLGGDAGQPYFAEGLTEEILNSLSAVDGLQVAARTSSFSFKEHPDAVAVARRLNVAAVLQGSVRRSGNTIRVTAQLVDAVTGFQSWSKTYSEEFGDVLKLQTAIATAVAEVMKVTLRGDALARMELGGTNNLAAFDAYVKGVKAQEIGDTEHDSKALEGAVATLTAAIRLDPGYALAFAQRSSAYVNASLSGPSNPDLLAKALADARRATALAPKLAVSHRALAYYFEAGSLDFAQADEEYERARALFAPAVCPNCALFAVNMGRSEPAISDLRRAVLLDPLNPGADTELAEGLYFSHRYAEAIAAARHALSVNPSNSVAYAYLGLAYYSAGDLEHARASCAAKPDYWQNQQCLMVTFDRLGRHAESEALLAKLKAEMHDDAAYQYATVYAQRGDTSVALDWLDTAFRLRDAGLVFLKTDPLMDPLRQEPRFAAIVRDLKFPD